jgi:hypothetical protein
MATSPAIEDLLKAAVGLCSSGASPIQAKYNPKDFEVERDRDGRLRNCGTVDTPTEPRFDNITTCAYRINLIAVY